MIAAVLALMLGAAAPVAGQASATPAQALAALSQAFAAHGMSPAGIAKVKAGLQAGAAQAPALVGRLQQAGLAAHNAAVATPFNPAAFEAAMRARKAAVLALASAQEDANINLYVSLSPADKKAFALTIVGGGAAPAR